MNSFAAGLQRVAEIARSGALGDDSTWIAAALEIHAANGWTLDRSFNLAWSNECSARSDSALCEYADRYCRQGLLTQRALRLGDQIRLYERGTWRHDRHREMPSFYVDTPHQYLFRALKENESILPQRDMPSGPRYLERMLSRWADARMYRSDHRLEPPEKPALNTTPDGGQSDALKNVSEFAKRRRQR